jgi:uncharacterized protein with NRDE domain
MCLILFAYRVRADAPLIVAANRDEFYARPTDAAQFWSDSPTVLAGRDLQAGGTWLGVDVHGRFAAVTNFSESPPAELPPGSRGELTTEFLHSDRSARDYAKTITGSRYRGFSLLLFDGTDLVCTSNRAAIHLVEPGVHGLANVELNCDWPKVLLGREALTELIGGDEVPRQDALLELLRDQSIPADEHLPRRGNEIEFERRAAPCFIATDSYGTRASTALVLTEDQVRFTEQNFSAHGVPGERFDSTFAINSRPA